MTDIDELFNLYIENGGSFCLIDHNERKHELELVHIEDNNEIKLKYSINNENEMKFEIETRLKEFKHLVDRCNLTWKLESPENLYSCLIQLEEFYKDEKKFLKEKNFKIMNNFF